MDPSTYVTASLFRRKDDRRSSDGLPLQTHLVPSLVLLSATVNILVVGGVVGWGTELQRVRLPLETLGFFVDLNIPAPLWSWGRLCL